MNIKKFDFSQSFNRNLFFVHLPGEILKTEFTYFPFPRIENNRMSFGIPVDSLIDIAVNKIFTIYQRTMARDYIDLYCICKQKGYTIENLTKLAKVKFDWHIDPIQLGSQFLKSQEVKDIPRMIKNISKKSWQNFFRDEALNLKKSIFLD